MFWKKKKDSKPEKKKKKGLLIQDEAATRGAFRVSPLADAPLTFKFTGKEVSAIDISEGGLAFDNSNFSAGTVEDVTFDLPGDFGTVSTKLEVIRIIEDKDICCCRFVKLSQDDQDSIGRYVLERQKQDLALRKSTYT